MITARKAPSRTQEGSTINGNGLAQVTRSGPFYVSIEVAKRCCRPSYRVAVEGAAVTVCWDQGSHLDASLLRPLT